MDNNQQNIEIFFRNYARNFNQALHSESIEVDATALAFAGCFIEAGPAGVQCGKNDDAFRNMIPQGYDFYRKIGITSMDILTTEITILDKFHAMTKIHWRSQYVNQAGIFGHIDFDVIYFTQLLKDDPVIFAYITGDEQAALKNAGLI